MGSCVDPFLEEEYLGHAYSQPLLVIWKRRTSLTWLWLGNAKSKGHLSFHDSLFILNYL